MRRGLDRRTLLRGLLHGSAVALGLPLLECMVDGHGEALAAPNCPPDRLPKRFGLFFWGNGNLPDRWRPTGQGKADAWSLSEQLAPLAPVKQHITVVSDLDVKLPNLLPHTSGAAGILSAAPTNAEEQFSAITIDQYIAQMPWFGPQTLYASLQTAATSHAGLSYSGENALHPAETDPFTFYERIFGPTFREPGGDAPIDPRLGLRQSVLDAVMDDVRGLKKQVGRADRARLDQHFTGLRELEQRLALAQQPIELCACVRPGEPLSSYGDVNGRPQIRARSRAMVDMLAMALACDQTRVFGHYLTKPVTDVLFQDVGAGHHDLTHNEPDPQDQVHEIVLQVMEELRYLVETFAAVDELNGSLLDHCAILATSDVSYGRTHDITDMPIVVAGSASETTADSGRLQTDLHHRAGKASATKLLVTLVNAVIPDHAQDQAIGSFGVDEAWVGGAEPNLGGIER